MSCLVVETAASRRVATFTKVHDRPQLNLLIFPHERDIFISLDLHTHDK